MSSIKIRNLGNSATELKFGKHRILVDAFHNWAKIPDIRDNDILLFTHDDIDHCDPNFLPSVKGRNIKIVAPSSVYQKIVSSNKADIDQIDVMCTIDPSTPHSIETGDLIIKSYSSNHFFGWKTQHNSYEIVFNNKKVFITGDTHLNKKDFPYLEDLDLIICNLVDEDDLLEDKDYKHIKHHLLSYILRIKREYSPQKIYGVHLLNFEHTLPPEEMASLVSSFDFNDIIIPTEMQKEEIFTL